MTPCPGVHFLSVSPRRRFSESFPPLPPRVIPQFRVDTGALLYKLSLLAADASGTYNSPPGPWAFAPNLWTSSENEVLNYS